MQVLGCFDRASLSGAMSEASSLLYAVPEPHAKTQPSVRLAGGSAFVCGILVTLLAQRFAPSSLQPDAGTQLKPVTPSGMQRLNEENTKPLFYLNIDLGMGSVQVPWKLTVGNGTGTNSSYRTPAEPLMQLPKIQCTQVLRKASLCAGCIPNDVDDSQVLAWAMNMMVDDDPRFRAIGASQTFGNADFASAATSLHTLMEGKGWTRDSSGEHKVYTLTDGDRTVELDFPHGASGGSVIDFEASTRKYIDIGGEMRLLEAELEYATDVCISGAVKHMHLKILGAPRPVHIVATGPLTDLSCLVRNFKGEELFSKIAGIYMLGGRRWGKGLLLCDQDKNCKAGLSDFNVRLNAVAAQTLLDSGLPAEKLIFVPFEMSGRFDTSMDVTEFVGKGALHQCDTTQRQFLMSNLVLRAQWYHKVLGMGERIWFWDLIPFYAALEPTAVQCHEVRAALVWCESAPGYLRFHGPSRKNHSANSCSDHAVIEDGSEKKPFPSMKAEAAQLWFCYDDDDCSSPDNVKFVKVTVCDEWTSQDVKDKFLTEMLHDAFY